MKKNLIKKGDNVAIIAGKNKGKKGKVINVFANIDKVVVEGVNERKKHRKPRQGVAGRIIDFSAPIHVSNVAIIDPKDNKPTRIGKKMVGGKYVRVAKRSGNELE